jgi:hypothetical protein
MRLQCQTLIRLTTGHGLHRLNRSSFLHHDDLALPFVLAVSPVARRSPRDLHGPRDMANDRTGRSILQTISRSCYRLRCGGFVPRRHHLADCDRSTPQHYQHWLSVDDEDHRLCHDPLSDLLMCCSKVSRIRCPAKGFGGSRDTTFQRERPKARPQRCEEGSLHAIFNAVDLSRHVRHLFRTIRPDILPALVRDRPRILHHAGLLHCLDRERSFVRGQDSPGLCR